MAADVAVRAHLAVVVAHDEDRLRAGLRRQVAARLRELGDVPGELPGALEDALLLALEDRWIQVGRGLQREAGGTVARAGAGVPVGCAIVVRSIVSLPARVGGAPVAPPCLTL